MPDEEIDVSTPGTPAAAPEAPKAAKAEKAPKVAGEKKTGHLFTGEGKTKYIRERIAAGVETNALVAELVEKFPGYDPKKAKSTINVQRSALRKGK
jgi:hypothetical protein